MIWKIRKLHQKQPIMVCVNQFTEPSDHLNWSQGKILKIPSSRILSLYSQKKTCTLYIYIFSTPAGIKREQGPIRTRA